MTLPRSFYNRSTVVVARALLGKKLVHETREGTTAGTIVETEAYLKDDSASHSFGGKTERNKAMFGSPGTAYVYLIYGMHECFNVVTRKEGIGEAVLIRALEPIEGIALMKRRRHVSDVRALCSGPAKLCHAMKITRKENSRSLREGALCIEEDTSRKVAIIAMRRIGINKNKEKRWRFCIKENMFVSR